jgi:MFS family permease
VQAQVDERQAGNWRQLLRNRNYLALWIGQMIAMTGDPFRQMALQVFVYDVTGSAAALGVLATVTALPTLALGPIAGVYVDRWDRRRIMLVSQVLRCLLVLGLVFRPSIFAVYAIGICTASIAVFYMPARNAILPRLVGEDQILLANSFSMTTGTLMMMIAPALASAVIGWQGTSTAFAVNSASFAGAALAVFAIRLPKGGGAAERSGEETRTWWQDVREGVTFIRGSPLVRGLLVIFGVQNLGFAAMPVLQIVYLDRVLGLPPSSLGYLMSCFAVGMFAGGGAMAAFGKRLPQTRLITFGCVGYGVLFLTMAATGTLPVVLAAITLMGVCEAALAVAVPTLIQQTVPDQLRGRVFSVQNVILTGLMVAGMGLAGAAAELLPVQTVMTIGGAVVLLGGLLGFRVFAGFDPVAARPADPAG